MVNSEGERPPITDYRDLDVWKEAMALAALTYETTRSFPRDEQFGMTSQMRRSSVSIAANIAESFGRAQTKPFIQFLRVSQGSLKELETLTALAERVSLLEEAIARGMADQCGRVGRMLVALIRALEAKDQPR
jgi:four helix bundle protein